MSTVFRAECVVTLINVELDEVVETLGLQGNVIKRHDVRCCDVEYQNAVLSKAYPSTGMLTPAEFIEMECSQQALSAFVSAVEFAYDHCEASVSRLQKPAFSRNAAFLMLSPEALRHLDITDALLPLLSRCRTAIGRRIFRQRLFQPFTEAADMIASYDEVDRLAACTDQVRRKLDAVLDLERLFKKIDLRKASVQDLLDACDSLRAAADVFSIVAFREHHSLAVELADQVCAPLSGKVDEPSPFREGTFAEIDATLSELDAVADLFRTRADALNAALGASDHVRVETDSDGGMHLSITAKRFAALKAKSDDDAFVQGCTLSQQGRVLHPSLDSRRPELAARLKAHVSKRLSEHLSAVILRHGDVLKVARAIGDVDVATTIALNSRELNLKRPDVRGGGGGGGLRAADLRHPVIESRDARHEYVPNTLTLDYEAPGGGGMLLYGVNAVGKSSIMKSLGIAVVMAQAGMFVAATLEFTPFFGMFTRIGLRDNIRRGHSTFVVEMLELRSILSRAISSRYLVIGDELCAGTESASALAIVGAGVKVLAERRVPFILATHLHELNDIPEVALVPGVRSMHLSVRIDEKTSTLVFDRKLTPGSGPRTYGLEVSKSLDLGKEFVRVAERIRRFVTTGRSGMVSTRRSRYNSQVIVDACGICSRPAAETHHIVPQAVAPQNVKHKRSNLLPLCSDCHLAAHDGRIRIDGYKLTERGVELCYSRTTDGETERIDDEEKDEHASRRA